MSTLMKSNSLFPMATTFFDDFFTKDWFDWSDKNFSALGSTLPSVNVRETENDYAIEVAAPGLRKEDFKLELENGVLTINGERREEKESGEKGKYTRKEFNYTSFSRSFRLPVEDVEDEQIDANYNHGILNITLPKKQAAKPKAAKMISVN